jgi:hypothetical protein
MLFKSASAVPPTPPSDFNRLHRARMIPPKLATVKPRPAVFAQGAGTRGKFQAPGATSAPGPASFGWPRPQAARAVPSTPTVRPAPARVAPAPKPAELPGLELLGW